MTIDYATVPTVVATVPRYIWPMTRILNQIQPLVTRLLIKGIRVQDMVLVGLARSATFPFRNRGNVISIPLVSNVRTSHFSTMDMQRQYPNVHWIWSGGISFVYEVHPCIVVKVPRSGEFEKEQFQKELEIYQIFSQNPPCPYIVQCYLYSSHGIFLEYMRGWTSFES